MPFTLAEKVTYLQNPRYPHREEDSVEQIVKLVKTNNNIHQIRLDFLEFHMSGGSEIDKPCNIDRCTIGGRAGKELRVGALCGNNKGQHLYIPAHGEDEEVATIRVEVGGLVRSRWNIRITQLEVTSDLVAPEGCEQYHHGE